MVHLKSTRLFKIFNAAILISFAYTPIGFASSNNQFSDVTKLVDVWLEAQVDYEDIPSISGVVVKDQSTLWHNTFGYANKETSLLATKNTAYSICSISKVITATAIMKLVDDGKLDLNESVQETLTHFNIKQKFQNGAPISVESLLNHSSGLPRDTSHSYWSGPEHAFPAKEALFTSLSKQETLFEVGARTAYSNVGYALLGQIIEEKTGLTYKQYLEDNVFAPLQMNSSFVEMQQELYGNRHAVGYTAKMRDGFRDKANFYLTKSIQPATGISTTAEDLAKFAKWQFRAINAENKELLSASSLEKMYTPTLNKNKGLGYNLTLNESGDKWVMHGGMCPGYVSYLKLDITNKMAYSILINANGVRAAAYVNGLIKLFKDFEKIEKNENDVTLSDYIGFYDLSPWNSEYYVGKWGKGLVLLYLPASDLRHAVYYYKPIAKDTFKLISDSTAGDEIITFIRNKQGTVVKILNGGNYHNKKRS